MTGTPGNNSEFLIPEPSGGDSVKQTTVEVGDSLSNFRSRNSSAQISDLSGNVGSNISRVLFSKKFVEVFSSGSEDFSLVNIRRVFREDHLR